MKWPFVRRSKYEAMLETIDDLKRQQEKLREEMKWVQKQADEIQQVRQDQIERFRRIAANRPAMNAINYHHDHRERRHHFSIEVDETCLYAFVDCFTESKNIEAVALLLCLAIQSEQEAQNAKLIPGSTNKPLLGGLVAGE